eukprot:TRINITY_DN4766_c0_g1_i3.p2 TRINITY_DN4766_c0_g1~~TRINITY_DN4766_c0_g1_i3.p2  ORF type:complete len:236 (+),score=38.49 TRINITY_DN4766_c0_g1_i3:1538-2245(+)
MAPGRPKLYLPVISWMKQINCPILTHGGRATKPSSRLCKAAGIFSTHLFNLEESGQTALGPAVLVSCAIAKQTPGSRVIICTDGLANIGIGSMEADGYRKFYRGIAKDALKHNTTLSLMSFKGSDCNIEALGEMATKTGGQVDIVDPASVHQNFYSMFSDDAIATSVSVTLFFPKHISVSDTTRQDDEWTIKKFDGDGGVVLHKKLGNVNSDSNVLMEFGCDKTEQQFFSVSGSN